MSALPKPAYWLEPMTQVSLAAVCEIEQAAYSYPWSYTNFRDSLQSGYSCWLWRNRDGIAGYVVLMLAAEEAHLLNITVTPALQGRGLGRELLGRVLRLARDYRARELLLEVRASNTVAYHLYKSEGFSEIGRRRDYYPAAQGREDALVLSRLL
jgi:ribosomal-protein-alanine N-acetyltransferase